MNIGKLLGKIGSSLLGSTPAGKMALTAINVMLPDGMKLSESSTATDAQSVIATLPSEEQSKIYLAEINLEVEEERGRTSRYEAMCAADGQETRAKMVNKAMNTLIGLSILFVMAICYVYITAGAAAAFSYELVAIFVAVSGTFAYVVRAYMGDLTTETKSRHKAIDDKPTDNNLMSTLIKSKLVSKLL